MAGHIYIHCRAAEMITYGRIIRLMAEGYFGSSTHVNPPNRGEASARTDWTSFEIFWAGKDHRPIHVERITDPKLLEALATEVAEKFEDHEVEDKHGIVARVRASRQTFHFEYGELTEVAWEMLDDAEMHLASHLDGIIESIEGFWTAELDQLVAWKPKT